MLKLIVLLAVICVTFAANHPNCGTKGKNDIKFENL